ncbi:histone acetyltransferases subunit 3-domain-containing protein [Truncatella angustata]|uniref:Histone acetyltransferases subunit 3-domain-containing protein n=1 Tax=Truncatella angustata TaxID=152316 RepID=A0A9P8USC3_9PEZI|nr:histone acetyltransferases subunit 3-domain-containing protein [Truncatella angustata]KAH6657353.1 histone acetyltransferases subunit 3-domain-containing protein [Truncatella angustata]
MPPAPSQKGTGKKNSGIVRQRSRNTTPSAGLPPSGNPNLPSSDFVETEFIKELKFESLPSISFDDLAESNASNAAIPDAKSLDGLIARLEKLHDTIESRGAFCDRGMRLVAGERSKMHFEDLSASGRDEAKPRRDDEERKANKKKRKANDSLAPPQEGKPDRSSPKRDSSKPRKLSRDNDSASSSLSPVAKETPGAMDVDEKQKPKEEKEDDDDESSEDEGAPPRREAPQFQTFGEDPSTYPDPTVYEILPVTPDMPPDQRREIYSVAVYPETDLADLIAGDPPDKDFTIAKPTNQISFGTFTTYIEPYFRTFNEEDLAFLRERGDRVAPFVMPKRGKRHYSEIWAEEDGAMAIDSTPPGRDTLPPNQPRGTIDHMADDTAESDKLSVGPILSRLLQAMRPEARAQSSEDKAMTNGINGEFEVKTETNGEANGINGINGISGVNGVNGVSEEDSKSLPPASCMPESSSEAWKKATHPKLDYTQVDERIKQELRHIGFLPQDGFDGDYDGHFDDEVAGRLRLLQSRLRDQMLINGARKARLTELVKERMAHQEYQTILEDLDTQVQGAYLKRTRTLGKSKKNKRPGGAGGGNSAAGNAAAGMARPGIGDVAKTLMERRRRWIDSIGTVFDDPNLGRVPRASDPDSSIFKPEVMQPLTKAERQVWDEEAEEE